MRIKIKEKSNVPKLEFGKTYEIIVTTVIWRYRFKFTRKNRIYLEEVNGSTVIGTPDIITKGVLKRLIKDHTFTERVVEVIN